MTALGFGLSVLVCWATCSPRGFGEHLALIMNAYDAKRKRDSGG